MDHLPRSEFAEQDLQREDQLWQAKTGLTFETLCGAMEAIIFVSDGPVSIKKIKVLIDEELPLRVIHQALHTIQENYERQHHGIRLMEVAAGYQFRTKATYAKYIHDLLKVSTMVLSPATLEVLAIIAYKQPVAKTEIDKIRGVDSSHLVRALVEKRLVKVAGRADEAGRPSLLSTTAEFLEVFNLGSLSELPPEQELRDMAQISTRSKISEIREIVQQSDRQQFLFHEMEELELLAKNIRNIHSDTAFTKELKGEEQKKLSLHQSLDSSLPPLPVPQRSAFEILEDFVARQEIAVQMQQAAVSELMIPGINPQVVSDFTQGPFNLPQWEEEEDFAMIDLDSGEVINQSNLQQAFSQLLSGNLPRPLLAELAESEAAADLASLENLESKEQNITALASKMHQRAEDLDLHLDFLASDRQLGPKGDDEIGP